MLDVHPPHEAAHTWRDFFIHIVTIVVGLIIAVGLEQTVEAIHHRHQLHEAREAIHAELEVNARLFDVTLSITQDAQKTMQRNARILQAAGPDDDMPTSALEYKWDIPYPRSNAWQDAKTNGAVNYMAPGERAETDYIYGDSDLAEKFAMSWLQENNVAAAIAHSATTVGKLTPQDRARLIEATQATEGQIASYQTLIFFDEESIKHYLTFPAQSGLQSPDPQKF
jgi:hypothetical protein